jgi:hypothetical protein
MLGVININKAGAKNESSLYIFHSGTLCIIQARKMILPQLENDAHGVDVAGMFFFEDNNYILLKGNPIGERLARVAKEKGMLLMGCDQCCEEREIEDGLVEGAVIGCFPNLYKALSGNMPDQIITL